MSLKQYRAFYSVQCRRTYSDTWNMSCIFMSVNFMSVIFMSVNFMLDISTVRHFHAWTFGPSFSCPSFSAPPLSTHNFLCGKFEAVSDKIATSCPSYFLTYDDAASNNWNDDNKNQGSYRSSTVKFLDFSLTSRHGMKFPGPCRNNNPIAQMLEMVHYMLRFIITIKHVIYGNYGAILSAARWSGGAL